MNLTTFQRIPDLAVQTATDDNCSVIFGRRLRSIQASQIHLDGALERDKILQGNYRNTARGFCVLNRIWIKEIFNEKLLALRDNSNVCSNQFDRTFKFMS